jgi:putative hemolysin
VSRLGEVPGVGDEVIVDAHRFEVTELDGRRIARVRVTPVPVAAPDDGQAEQRDSDLPE